MSVKGAVMVPHPPLIIPEIGGGEERKIQDTVRAYEAAAKKIAEWKPDTVIVISPHAVMYSDYIHISPGKNARGNFRKFRAPGVAVMAEYDEEFVAEFCGEISKRRISAGIEGEREKELDHGTMIPLWFLNHYYSGYKLVRIGISGLSYIEHYRLGQCIRDVSERLGKNIAVIGSGDLSHKLKADGPYGFDEKGPEYDRKIMEVMGNADFGKLLEFSEEFCSKAAECGHRAFIIMAGALDGSSVSCQKLSYEGPFGVGYGICTYEVESEDQNRKLLDKYIKKSERRMLERRSEEDPYVKLARMTVETFIQTGRRPDLPDDLPCEMYENRAGVFVSMKIEGRLRGCIGTISPSRQNIVEEIVENAVSSATRDPRFERVRPEELSQICYSVDVLGKTEKIASKDELDVKRYGVVVSKGLKRGLLLPNLEGVDTVEEQIEIAKRKAGIYEDEENICLERFEVVRHY